jgi:O-acetyl-ADP-ribose deacetylase (regulator of RNase III)
MIIEMYGDLLKADAEALVNPVNTVGVMGAGLALQFRTAYPDNYRAYRNACGSGELWPGRVFVWERGRTDAPRFIVNFPTKTHWRLPSLLPDIAEGLRDLRQVIADYEMRSIAVPALGCGLGGLGWDEVYPLIKAHLGNLEGVQVLVYPPQTERRS